ncbi:hypothetical protein [Pseudomonas batumici]|uniref:Uncharacterized protein n=1 Tax=Pseudomonas batumici TaxID=226910 RepID=A0A0C2EY97_9PSED|nr:hypothetical protein [Pseudomonas batumici]KIH83743.1 hypothetical protein UCMB321_2485 [Pseudomonas batumici]
MATEYNLAFMIAAALNALAAVHHIGTILVGPTWYRLFGARERFARAAEVGRAFPAVVTSAIALVLLVGVAYALAGAGVISPLPLLRPALCAITVIYLLRGLAGAFMLAGSGRSNRFVVITSVAYIGYGVTHLVGLVQMWGRLA